jgi:hypothetical protein
MKKLLALLFFTILLTSCSSGLDSDSTSNAGILLQKIVRESESGDVTTTYVYEGNKMKTNSFSTYVNKFYYTGNLVTKVDSYNNNQLMSVFTFEYDGSQKLIQSTISSPDIQYAERNTYEDNDDNTIAVNHYRTIDGGTEILQSQKYFTDTDGEIIRIEKYDTSGTAISLYTYDTKNNPYKNVIGFDKLLNIFTLGVMHNTLTTHETGFDGTVYHTEKTITYNAQDYPVTMQYEGSSSIEHYYY